MKTRAKKKFSENPNKKKDSTKARAKKKIFKELEQEDKQSTVLDQSTTLDQNTTLDQSTMWDQSKTLDQGKTLEQNTMG